MTNQDANRPQRIKIIIISIIAAILVFIIGAWLITSAIKSVEKKHSETNTSEQSASKDENKTSSNEAKNNANTGSNSSSNATSGSNSVNNTNSKTTDTSNTGTVNSPAAQYNNSAAKNSGAVASQKSNMPNTGPEELLPTAILIGAASYLFFKNREYKARAVENRA